jgi:hypothetical protein
MLTVIGSPAWVRSRFLEQRVEGEQHVRVDLAQPLLHRLLPWDRS